MRGLECNQRLEVTNRGTLPAFQKTQGPSGVASRHDTATEAQGQCVLKAVGRARRNRGFAAS